MPEYLLLLYDNSPALSKLGPEEMQKATEKYMAWMQKAFTKGGKRLTPDAGRIMSPNGSKPRVTDGPYIESKEILGGYYLIEAASYDEAVERTMDHPHIEYGGTVEVRQIWGM